MKSYTTWKHRRQYMEMVGPTGVDLDDVIPATPNSGLKVKDIGPGMVYRRSTSHIAQPEVLSDPLDKYPAIPEKIHPTKALLRKMLRDRASREKAAISTADAVAATDMRYYDPIYLDTDEAIRDREDHLLNIKPGRERHWYDDRRMFAGEQGNREESARRTVDREFGRTPRSNYEEAKMNLNQSCVF